MLLKIVVVLFILVILASLGSALLMFLRGNREGMVRALTWRIGLSLALFLLLIAGFHFGFIVRTA